VSRQFLVSSFVPTLVFAFLNGAVLYGEREEFRTWIDTLMVVDTTFKGVVVLIAVSVVAYVLRGVSPFLADVLSGRHLPRRWPFHFLATAEQKRLQDLRDRYYGARDERARIDQQRDSWTAALRDAGIAGLTAATNTYDGKSGPAATWLDELRGRRVAAGTIAFASLGAAVNAFAVELNANSLKVALPDGINPLADDHRDLLTLVDYALDRWGSVEVALAEELQQRFGLREVAPTAFGNVVAALRSYGLTRYRLSLPTVWTRLQGLLKADEPYLATLEAAKAQVDFSVVSCWLAMVSTAIWGMILPFFGSSPIRFVTVMTLGPILARLAYLSAVENYVAFAEVVRAGVDLHRFRLLDALSLPRPASLGQERRLWEALRRVTDFGQESIDMSYVVPEDEKP
jgi:hypothetical protein